jgi:hypothetical protein
MTRGELRTRILRDLNASPTVPHYWTAEEINGYLQEGYELMAETAPLISRTFFVPRRPGVQMYQLPGVGDEILAPYRVWLPDQHRRLEARTLADLDQRVERWLVTHGTPWWWYPVSWDQFGIWPSAGEGAGWLEVDCLCWPTALRDDGDEPEFHPSTHQTLVTYGTWLGYLKQWQPQHAADALARFFGQAGSVRSQAGVRQLQEAHWGRETHP